MAQSTYKSNLSADEKALMGVVRAAEIFKRAHSGVFRDYGLSFPQYNVLRVLEASKKGHNKISDVSRIMLVPGANMTGIAARLEKSSFIRRKCDRSDERVTILEITPKAKRALKQIESEKDERLESQLKGFSKAEKLQLLGMVKRLIKRTTYRVREEAGSSHTASPSTKHLRRTKPEQ